MDNTSFQTKHIKRERIQAQGNCVVREQEKVDTHLQKKPSSQVKSVCVCVCVLLKKSKKNMFDEYMIEDDKLKQKHRFLLQLQEKQQQQRDYWKLGERLEKE